jgi:hypothetical protein
VLAQARDENKKNRQTPQADEWLFFVKPPKQRITK